MCVMHVKGSCCDGFQLIFCLLFSSDHCDVVFILLVIEEFLSFLGHRTKIYGQASKNYLLFKRYSIEALYTISAFSIECFPLIFYGRLCIHYVSNSNRICFITAERFFFFGWRGGGRSRWFCACCIYCYGLPWLILLFFLLFVVLLSLDFIFRLTHLSGNFCLFWFKSCKLQLQIMCLERIGFAVLKFRSAHQMHFRIFNIPR